MTSRRILITGLSTYWGGRLAQALERDPRSRRSSASTAARRRSSWSAPSSCEVADSHSLIRRIVEAAEIDTVVDTRLVVDSIVTTPAPGPREQRHRDDERARGVRRRGLPGAQGRLQVQRPLLRRRAGRPGVLHRGHAPPAPAAHADRARHRRGRARRARTSRPATPTRRSPCCASPTASGPALRTSHTALLRPARRARRSSASTRAMQFIHEDDIAGCLEHAVRHDLDGVYNCAADGVLALTEVAGAAGQAARADAAAVGDRRWPPRALRRVGVRIPPECCSQLRFGRALDNRRLKATGYRYRYTTRETVLKLREHQRLAPLAATPRRGATATSARSRSSCAAARACAPPTRAPAADAARRLATLAAAASAAATAPGRERRRAGYDDLERRARSSPCCPRWARGARRAARPRARARRPARRSWPRSRACSGVAGAAACACLHSRRCIGARPARFIRRRRLLCAVLVVVGAAALYAYDHRARRRSPKACASAASTSAA